MKIGIDIDNVVFDTVTPMLEVINERYDTKFKLQDVDCYSLSKSLGLKVEPIRDIIEEVTARDEAPVMSGVDQALKWLQRVCSPLYFISARPTRHYRSTYKQLEKVGLSDNVIILTNQLDDKHIMYTKTQYVTDLKIDIFIDDKPNIILNLLYKTDCHVVIFDRPWNEKIEWPVVYNMTKRVDRVYHWGELRDFFYAKLKDEL